MKGYSDDESVKSPRKRNNKFKNSGKQLKNRKSRSRPWITKKSYSTDALVSDMHHQIT